MRPGCDWPKPWLAHGGRRTRYRKLGQYESAVAEYTRSLELQPRNIKTYNNRAYGALTHPSAGY